MAGNSVIGKVSVKIWPDTRGFRKEAEAGLRSAEKSLDDLEVQIDVDSKKLVADANKSVRAAQRKVKDLTVEIDYKDNGSLKKHLAQVDKDLDGIRNTDVNLDFNRKSLEGIKRRLEDDLAMELRVDGKATRDTKRALSEVRDELDRINDQTIKVKADRSALEKTRREISQAILEVTREKDHEVALRMEFDRSRAREQLRRLDSEMAAFRKISLSLDKGSAARVRREMEDLLLKRDDLTAKIAVSIDPMKRHLLERDLRDVGRRIETLRSRTTTLNREVARQSDHWHNVNRNIQRGVGHLHTFRRAAGRAMGEGSRNNFLNFFGRRVATTLAGLTAPLLVVSGLIGGLTKGMDTFYKAIDSGVSKPLAVLKGLGSGFSSITSSLFSTIAAVAALVVGLGSLAIVTPIVTMLAGAMAALAGSITLGLIGSLLPLGPLLVALGAGAGVAAAAFVPLIDDIKKGKGEFRAAKGEIDKLKKSVNDLGKSAAPALGRLASTFARGANSIVRAFSPVIEGLFENLDNKLNSPSMDKFYDQWRNKMPRVVSQFGQGLNSMLVGLIAFFAPILDFADRLAAGFKRAMDRFAEWAKSAEGQNAIADFMEKAWDRAKQLWRIVKLLGKGIWNILSSGDENAGKSMFDSIEDSLEKFERWSKSDAVDEFFEDVKEFGSELKKTVENISEFFEELNKPENRKKAEDFAETVGEITDALEPLAWVMSQAGTAMMGVLKTVTLVGGAIAGAFSSIDWGGMLAGIQQQALQIPKAIIDGIVFGLQNAPAVIAGVVMAIPRTIITVIKSALGIASPSQVMIALMGDVAAGIIQGLVSTPGRIIGFALAIPRAIIGAFAGLVGKVAGAVGPIAGTVAGTLARAAGSAATGAAGIVIRIVGTLATLPGRATSAIAGIVSTVGGVMSSAATAAVGAAAGLVSRTVGTLGSLPGRAAGAIGSIVGALSGIMGSAATAVVGAAASLVGRAVGILGGLPGRAASAVSGIVGKLAGIASRAMSAMAGGIASGMGAVISAAGAIPGAIRSAVGDLSSLLVGAGRSAAEGLAKGIRSGLGSARSAAKSLASIAASAARSKLKINSPSKVFIGIGGFVSEGLAKGIGRGHAEVARSARSVGQAALDATRKVLEINSPSRAFLRVGTQTVRGFTRGTRKASKASRKDLVKDARIISKGFELGLKFQASNVRNAINHIIKQIPKMHNVMARNWAMNTARRMKAEMKQWDRLHAQYTKWTEQAKELRQAKADFAEGMVSDAVGIAGLQNIEGGFDEVIHRLTVARQMTDEFEKHLATLRKNGLRKDLYEQIADMGAESGLAAAKAIADAGKKGVDQVNKLQQGLLKSSSKAADNSSSHLYDAGINMASSIANGFAKEMNSVEARLRKMARDLAININQELRSSGLKQRVDIPFLRNNAATYTQQSSGTSRVLNYYAAPGTQASNEQQLFRAFKRAGF